MKSCREEYPFGGVEGTIVPLPKEARKPAKSLPDVEQDKAASKSVSVTVSDQKEYATLEAALKTASDKGIIKLKIDSKKGFLKFKNKGGKQYIVLGSYAMEELADLDKGLCFGDGQKEDLFWEVIDYAPQTRSALVICRNVVAFKPYDTECASITWEKCTLRKWLNRDFYDTAFKTFEKEIIVETKISNPDNEEWIRRSNAGRNESWWLRSPGCNSRSAAYVAGPGVIIDDAVGNVESMYEGNVTDRRIGVCPAFWLKLDP